MTVDVGTASCPVTLAPTGTGGRGGCSIRATALPVGPYTATASYGGNTDLSGSGPATTPFTVTSPGTIDVSVTGAQTYGGAPSFSETNDAPAGVTITGTLVCTTVDGGQSVSTSLAAGDHTVDGASCSGLTSSNTNYPLSYEGTSGGYVVSKDSSTTKLSKSAPFLSHGDEQAVTLTVSVLTGNGESLPTSDSVTVDVGTTACVATVAPAVGGGQGGCSIGANALAVGPYTASATYGGDTDVTGSGPATTGVPVTQGSTDAATYSCVVPGFKTTGFPVFVSESPSPPASVDAGGTFQTTPGGAGDRPRLGHRPLFEPGRDLAHRQLADHHRERPGNGRSTQRCRRPGHRVGLGHQPAPDRRRRGARTPPTRSPPPTTRSPGRRVREPVSSTSCPGRSTWWSPL